ncbi:hypothetical protein WJX84_002310 [Apatococcus fuscideae]
MLLGGNLVHVGVVLVVTFGTAVLRLSSSLLSGVTTYRIPPEDAPQVLKSLRPANGKTRKSDPLGTAGSLAKVQLRHSEIEKLEFYKQLDHLVLFLGFASTLFWLDELLSRSGWLPRSGLAPAFCVVCLAVAIWALIKVQLLTKLALNEEKGVMLYMGLGGLLVSGLWLERCPVSVMDHQLPEAVRALNASLREFFSQYTPDAEVAHDLFPSWLMWPLLCIPAGLIAALMLPAGMRSTRSFFQALNVPSWAQGHASFTRPQRILLHITLLLQMLVPLLWIRPISERAWKLPADATPAIQGAALVTAGLLQVCVLRPLAQSYLNTALLHWHHLKHDLPAKVAKDSKVDLPRIMRLRVDMVNSLFCKVGTQLFAPAVILIASGLMLVQAAYITELGPAGEWVKDDIRSIKIPVAFYQTLGSFFGWWTSSCWAVVCGSTLLAFGTGIVQEGGTEKKPQ